MLASSTALPKAKMVKTPDGIPNETFGDIAMVAEFMNTYKGLMMQDEEELPVNTSQLP